MTRCALIFSLALTTVVAAATPCRRTFQASNAFNFIARSSASCRNSDIEGRAFVFGDATFDSYSIGEKARRAATPYDWSLLVGNVLHFNNGTVWEGAVGYGQSLYATETAHFLQSARKVDIRAIRDLVEAEWTRARESLDAAPANAAFARRGDKLFVETTLEDSVVDVPAAMLTEIHEFVVRAPANGSVVFRITGASAQLTSCGFAIDSSVALHTLFYFADTRQIRFKNVGFKGTVFAPLAQLQFDDGAIFGNVYVNSFVGSGQVNQTATDGCFGMTH